MHDAQDVGTDSAVTLVRMEEHVDEKPGESDSTSSSETIDGQPQREGWDNKVQYILAQIGFAVGLGNVWRFPYLCQKNGGGAFLIPYFIMLMLEGIPLFYMEIAIGQRLRRGSVGVWNHIHRYLGGVGIASMVVCFLIALYYNMIISWAFFYFFNSFQSPLPWKSCPVMPNMTVNNHSVEVAECAETSPTSYFWYRNALDISPSINEPGSPVWRMCLSLVVAWLIVFIGMFKGIKSSGKVVYFSATFPYIVLVIFFFRGITLPGSMDGVAYMFTPDMSRLADATVWRDAATQIFFSLGLGFGGVIAYSSYNDLKNNCRKDALTVASINCATSIFASLVIFSILGFKAHHRSEQCMDHNIIKIHAFFNEYNPDHNMNDVAVRMDRENYIHLLDVMNKTFYSDNDTAPEILKHWLSINVSTCTIKEELQEAVSGPGLAFIAFTEAMINMPGGPFWSVMFFCMLINLGLGSMFGTLEGIITPLRDLGLNIPKEAIVAILCLISLAIGMIFTLRSGMYILDIFDTYAGTLPLLMIAFFETIGVAWIYGFSRFSDDLKLMLGDDGPGLFWKATWCVISPLCMLTLFVSSIVTLAIKTPQYEVYVLGGEKTKMKVDYPGWAIGFIICLIFCSIIWIPIIAFLRWRGYLNYASVDSASKKGPTNSYVA
ncbi:sodium-dependent neutral amino acid transporter B(0)AT3-like [Ciona intestinalis]